MADLKAKGVTFPIKIQYPYNPAVVDWDKQCQVFKQQVEAVLNDGFDFISIIITQGPSDNFLNAVRRVGAYQLMSYYWGADYSDPETEVYPFYQEAGDRGTCYSFLRTGVEDGIVTGETADLVMQYMSMVENAKTITEDLDARYEAFADAEASVAATFRKFKDEVLPEFYSHFATSGVYNSTSLQLLAENAFAKTVADSRLC